MLAVGFPSSKVFLKKVLFLAKWFHQTVRNQTDTHNAHSLEKPKIVGLATGKNVQLAFFQLNDLISYPNIDFSSFRINQLDFFMYMGINDRQPIIKECPKAKIAFKFRNLKIHTHTAIYSFASILIHYRTKNFCTKCFSDFL